MCSPELPETTEWQSQPAGSGSFKTDADSDAATRANITRMDLGTGTTAPDSDFERPLPGHLNGQQANEISESNSPGDLNLGKIVELEMGGERQQVRINSILGIGGMGKVYKASSLDDPKIEVAIKVVKNRIANQRVAPDSKLAVRAQSRFCREIEILSELDHPHIVSFIGNGKLNQETPCFAMELLHNQTIVEYCNTQQLDLNDRLLIFRAVCEGVLHCHKNGIIHRDLKPGNILIQQTAAVAIPKLIDFGIAKRVTHLRNSKNKVAEAFSDQHHDFQVTDSKTDDAPLGTVQYMSPEQSRKETSAVGHRSDIYSLGVLLYELITGAPPLARQPIDGSSFETIVKLIASMPTPELTNDMVMPDIEIMPQQVLGLNHLLSRMLSREVDDRYQDVGELIADVNTLVANADRFAEPALTELADCKRIPASSPAATGKSNTPRRSNIRTTRQRPNSFGFIGSTVAACMLILAYFFVQDSGVLNFCEESQAASQDSEQPVQMNSSQSSFFCLHEEKSGLPGESLQQLESNQRVLITAPVGENVQLVQVEKKLERVESKTNLGKVESSIPSLNLQEDRRDFRLARNRASDLLLPDANVKRHFRSNQPSFYRSNKTRWLVAPQLTQMDLQEVDCDPTIQAQALRNFSTVVKQVNSGTFTHMTSLPTVSIRGVAIPGMSGLIKRIPHKTLSRCLFNGDEHHRVQTTLNDF